MKRSEALSKLKEYIRVSTDYDTDILMLNEEEILDFVENELGMQPPNITKMPTTWFRSTGDYGYEAAEWESENEEK